MQMTDILLPGYPMAQNLRSRIPESDTLTVYDVNAESLDKFKSESSSSKIQVAKSPKEVAHNSVRLLVTSHR